MPVRIYGIQAAQAAMLRAVNAARPGNGLQAALKEAAPVAAVSAAMAALA